MIAVKWRKSSRSGNGGASCVELGTERGQAPLAVRDSKNPAGPSLQLDLAAFLADVRAGRFDLS